MTKTYEALENAARSRGGGASIARSSVPKSVESALLSLYQRVDSTLGSDGGKAIGFADAEGSADASVLLAQLARLASSRLNKRVLVLAATANAPVTRIIPASGAQGWEGVISGERNIDELIQEARDGGVSAGIMAASEQTLPAVVSSPAFKSALSRLRQRFDLILVDAPPLGATADLALLTVSLDGVVVVAEAGQSRRQAVRRAADEIAAQGGRVLGVVLNRRRFYIPAFIYSRL